MSLETGLESLKRGEFVLLFDSANRENEIDMVVAAEFITPEHVARMRQNAGGLLCIALENNFAKSLELQYMHEILASSSISNKEMNFESDLPNDFVECLNKWRNYSNNI